MLLVKHKECEKIVKITGFTLIEMMVVIAISSIVLLIAVPSFRDIVQRNRFEASENGFIQMLKNARNESVKRNTGVRLSPLAASPPASNEWGEGVRVWVDNDNDDSYDVGEEILEIEPFSGVQIDANPNFTSMIFRPNGRVEKLSGAVTYTFNICVEGRSEGATVVLSVSSSILNNSVKNDCSV